MSNELSVKVPFMMRARLVVYGLVAGLLVGGGGAGYVWWQGQQALAEVTAASQAAADQAAAAQQQHDTVVARMERSRNRLQARVLVSQANEELDRRNFGTAAERVAQAAARLEGDEDAAGVRSSLKSVSLEPGEDLQAPHSVLIGLGAQLDALIAH
jgi:hypothetical protein